MVREIIEKRLFGMRQVRRDRQGNEEKEEGKIMVGGEEIRLEFGEYWERREDSKGVGWKLSKRRVVAKPSGMKRKDRRIQREEQRRSR